MLIHEGHPRRTLAGRRLGPAARIAPCASVGSRHATPAGSGGRFVLVRAGTRLEEKAPPTSGVQFTDLRPTPILEEPTQAKGLCPAPKLGIIRLDYDYPPDPGDMDYPGSFPFQVHLLG